MSDNRPGFRRRSGRTHFGAAARPSSLWHEKEDANEEETCSDGRDEVHPSPAQIDDDVWRCDSQGNNDDSLRSEDTTDPRVAFVDEDHILEKG